MSDVILFSDSSFYIKVCFGHVGLLVVAVNLIGSCERRFIRLGVNFEGCQTRAFYTFRCVGSCPSYSQSRLNGDGGLERHCTCCREYTKVTRNVTLRCREDRNRTMILQHTLPIDCTCRPCSVVPVTVNRGEDT